MTAKCPADAYVRKESQKGPRFTISASVVLICNGFGRVLFYAASEDVGKFSYRPENYIRIAEGAELMERDEMIRIVKDYIFQCKYVCGWHMWADLSALEITVNRTKTINLSTNPVVRAIAQKQLAENPFLDNAIQVSEFWERAEFPMSLANFALVMSQSATDLRRTTGGVRRVLAVDAYVCRARRLNFS